jgi:hypothetical protein
MFKRSSRQPPARRLSARSNRATKLYLPQAIEEDRAIADRTQRAVARGRCAVVEMQARVLQFRHSQVEAAEVVAVKETHQRLAELLQQLDVIHQRLLRLSVNIELEIDRLDVTRLEIDQLTGGL